MSYNRCMDKYKKYLRDPDSVEGDTPEEVKKDGISKERNPKTFEIREVELLPPEIEPSAKTTGLAEKLKEKRKTRHDELMKKLADDLHGVNVRIEENIRISSEEVKAHMKVYKDRLREKLTTLDTPQVASYHESVFLDIQKEADGMRSHQLRLVQELYDDLIKFENLRSAENERIFHSSFQEIEKAAYILPYELQSFIEHEALKMNQLTLNNRRCYEDLKLKLILVTEQTFKSFIDEVFCLKEKWTRYNMQEAMDLRYSRYEQGEKLVTPPPPQTRLELTRHELVLKLTPDNCFSIVKAEEWFWNIKDVCNTLDDTNKILSDLHKQVIKAVNRDLRSECDEVRKTLLSLDRLHFEERSIQPIVFRTGSASEENMDTLEVYWQNSLKDIKGKLEDSYALLTNFAELWNRHVERLCESKVLVLRAVEKAEENSVNPLQELEVKVNLTLDALRQEYIEGKLDALYAAAVANLDAIKEKLESDYINEVTIAEEYYKMMDLEADVLSSELKEFVYLNLSETPETEEETPKLEEGEILEMSIKIRGLFSEISNLKSWKFELRGAMDDLADNTRERIAWRAETWVTNRVQEISMKYQTQLEMHHKRYDRIRCQIYEVRQQEIYTHQTVFDEHKAGVEDVYRKLAEATENFYDKSTEKLESCRSRVTAAVGDAKKEDRAASLKCIQTQIQRQKAEFMTEVAVKSDQAQQEIEFRVSSTQLSNLKFMKSIRLFHENGNYDADEAKSYVTYLENIDRECSSEGKAAIRETRKRETEVLQKASEVFDDAIRTLMQLNDELQFYGTVKNVIHLCRNEFQELSAALKDDFDSLTKHADFMGVCIADETSFMSQDGDGLWFILIAVLYKNVSNLFYTLDVPEWLANAVEETQGSTPEKKVQVPQTSKGKDAKSENPGKDFREEVFDPSMLTDNAPIFMNTVCRKCWDYMDTLQRSGYAFYKTLGSKSLIRGDLLKPSYEEFGIDTCQVFRSFALQCEAVWLQMIRGFLPVLGTIKTLLKACFERRVREYAQNVITALDKYDMEFTNCFNKNSCHMLRELQCLDSKLLPLHGYPRNGHLLTALEDEVVTKTAELELSWEVFTDEYENKLKSVRKLTTPDNKEYQTLKAVYTQCRDAVFAEELGPGVILFLDKIIDKKGYIKKTGKTSAKTADRESLLPYVTVTYNSGGVKPPERHKLNLHHLQGGLEDAVTYFAEIKHIIRTETATVPLESDASREDWLDLLEPKLGLLTDAEEFEEMIAQDARRIKTVYREVKQFFRSKKNFHKEVVFEWLDRWKANVEKNAALYTVKYPDGEDA